MLSRDTSGPSALLGSVKKELVTPNSQQSEGQDAFPCDFQSPLGIASNIASAVRPPDVQVTDPGDPPPMGV